MHFEWPVCDSCRLPAAQKCPAVTQSAPRGFCASGHAVPRPARIAKLGRAFRRLRPALASGRARRPSSRFATPAPGSAAFGARCGARARRRPQNRGRMCQCVRTRPAGPRRATFAPRGGTAADQEGVAPTPACEGTARLHGSTRACVRESGRRHRAASAGCATAPARDNVKSNQIFHMLCPLTQALTFRSSNR